MTENAVIKIQNSIKDSIDVKAKLMKSCMKDIDLCANKLAETCSNDGKIMFCGNGGSAADSQHLAAELVIRLRGEYNRGAIAGMALSSDPSIMTAGGNDIGFENIFAREVMAYGKEGDALVCISTSGNSPNVLNAALQAQKMGITVIGLLGSTGGAIMPECEYSVCVPSEVTARIQESHIMIGHIWCEIIEETLFPDLFE